MQEGNRESAMESADFTEYRKMKREEEVRASVGKIECDCLSAYTDKTRLKDICKSANSISLGAVVVYPAYVKACVSYLGNDPQTSLIAEISYPHGLDTTEIKVSALKRAIKDGVDEVEVCAPMQLIRDGNMAYFKRECKKLKKAAKHIPLRLVYDCAAMSEGQIIKLCNFAAEAGLPRIRLNGADGETLGAVKKALRDKCVLKADGVESFASFADFSVYGAEYMASKEALSLARVIAESNGV